MSAENELSKLRVAILGLGLMGGSLALALKGKCREIIGIDTNIETLEYARRLQMAKHLSRDAEGSVGQADVVVLAVPVLSIIAVLKQLPAWHSGPAVILDLGSTKAEICQEMAKLPGRFDPLGGHPICGKERLGIQNAEAAIYQGAPFAITPLERTSAHGRKVAVEIATAIGAVPLWLEPETHDRWVAATSHLPFLLSAALVSGTRLEVKPLIGPGFLSTSRLAATPGSMMLDVLKTNRGNILDAMNCFKKQMEMIERQLNVEAYDALIETLARAVEQHKKLTMGGNKV